jgi:hypothetical protein
MTGCIFSYQKQVHDIKESVNKVYLYGKPMPLLVEKSVYSKYSTAHCKLKEGLY